MRFYKYISPQKWMLCHHTRLLSLTLGKILHNYECVRCWRIGVIIISTEKCSMSTKSSKLSTAAVLQTHLNW